jgi:hypothetical protein
MATIPVKERYWEVWQGDVMVCSAEMRMTRDQAGNKVANERRHGIRMEAKPAVCVCSKLYWLAG